MIYQDLTQANVAKSKNRRFKAKNMVAWNFANPKRKSHLISSQRNSSSFQIVRLIGILCSRKNSKKKLEEKLKKISKAKDYTKKLLQNCKS